MDITLKEAPNKVDSYVTKSFLVDIITRDIGILDAILELVDNSLDRAIEIFDIDVTKSLTEDYSYSNKINLPQPITINIEINKDYFLIEDNCGGISKEELIHDVFIFGLPKEGPEYSGLSAFGIGMKRAFFKLGKLIDLHTRTKTEESSVLWNIEEWMSLGKDNWDIPFTPNENSKRQFSFSYPGTIIQIENLTPSVKTRFEQPEFITALKNRLQTSYALFLKSGFKIILNQIELTYSLPNFITSDEIGYTSKLFHINDVDYRILAGITPINDRTPRGWYVFCNGRMVLEADRTHYTGWGTIQPAHHPKFNHFLGLISFSSKNVKALPWSSTKWGVELDSPIYISALEEMRIQAIPILNILDRWKDLKDDDELVITALQDLLKEGITTSVFASANQERTFKYSPKKEVSDDTRITFLAKKEIVQKIKESLGDPKMKNTALGEFIFDYYIERELD